MIFLREMFDYFHNNALFNALLTYFSQRIFAKHKNIKIIIPFLLLFFFQFIWVKILVSQKSFQKFSQNIKRIIYLLFPFFFHSYWEKILAFFKSLQKFSQNIKRIIPFLLSFFCYSFVILLWIILFSKLFERK